LLDNLKDFTGTMIDQDISLAFSVEGKIAITSKMAKRAAKDHDKRDGMKAIGPGGEFPIDYDIRWVFHKSDDDKEYSGTEYAVSSKEIKRNVDKKMPQIFVSNMQQFNTFRERFGNRVIFLYLHRLSLADEIKEFQYKVCATPEEAEIRIGEIQNVHQNYIDQITDFHHVLLNTTYPEDLYDQMFQLIQCYKNKKKQRPVRGGESGF